MDHPDHPQAIHWPDEFRPERAPVFVTNHLVMNAPPERVWAWFALMSALGFERFAMVGHDIGMWTGYAMAADQPARLVRIVLGEAITPGLSDSPRS